MTEKSPHQQLFVVLPEQPTTNGRPRRDKPGSLEYETHMLMMEAEEASRKPNDRCNVGYSSIKASFRR